MIAKIPSLTATCDACGDEAAVPLERRGNGLWYDGRVDSELETRGWYVVGDLAICDLCHADGLEDAM